jgi:aldose 1-epimerase
MQYRRTSRRASLAAAILGAGACLALLSGPAAGAATATGHARATHGHRGATRTHSSPSRAGAHAGAALSITSTPWGTANGTPVDLFTLSNGSMTVTITNYGGTIQSIDVPNSSGGRTNVALGFPNLTDYVDDFTQGATATPWPLPGGSGDTFFGATIGRYANRIANASFNLNGTTYTLDANNGSNTLHGGYLGWNTQVWSPATSESFNSVSLQLTNLFPAGEGCDVSLSPGCTGFPAPVMATVTFTLTRANQLKISYSAVNESPNLATVINLTNHTYFNLAGEASGSVYDQLLALNSDQYTPVNTNLIPEAPYFVPVGGTAYDFRTMHPIGENIRNTNLPDGTYGPFKQLQIAHGYDNNWVLNGQGGYRLVAVAQAPSTGVTLWTYTDQPGVQFYSGNFLVGDLIGTSGDTYRQSDGFTLETQHYPDAPNHIGDPAWPSVVLPAGGTFTSQTAYAFTVNAQSLAGKIRFR